MRCAWAFSGLMSSAGLLWPFTAGAESQVQTTAVSGKLNPAAHADFKIVIPKVLYLDVLGAQQGMKAHRVAIFSNGHNVMLAATVSQPGGRDPEMAGRAPTSSVARAPTNIDGRASTSSLAAAPRSLILSAAARRIIAQEAPCTLVETDGRVLDNTSQMVCTVSMP